MTGFVVLERRILHGMSIRTGSLDLQCFPQNLLGNVIHFIIAHFGVEGQRDGLVSDGLCDGEVSAFESEGFGEPGQQVDGPEVHGYADTALL